MLKYVDVKEGRKQVLYIKRVYGPSGGTLLSVVYNIYCPCCSESWQWVVAVVGVLLLFCFFFSETSLYVHTYIVGHRKKVERDQPS